MGRLRAGAQLEMVVSSSDTLLVPHVGWRYSSKQGIGADGQ